MFKLTTFSILLGSFGLALLPGTQLIAQAQQTQSPEFAGLVGTVFYNDSIPNKTPTYRNLPRGLTPMGGWMILDPKLSGFMVGMARMNSQDILLLEKTLQHRTITQSNGIANFQVLKILDVIAIPTGMRSMSECQLNGEKLPRVLGLVSKQTPMNQRWITQLAQVWQVNAQTQKFERVNIPGISCENEGWGI
jgi:hypothetical protein